jgi:hypothetical protein
MQRILTPLVVLLFATTAFAGCIGASTEDEPLADQKAPTTNNVLDEDEAQAPDDREISAFKETNKTESSGIGAMMHAHDYWQGRERVDVTNIVGGLIPFPLKPGGPDSDMPYGTAIADFDIPSEDGLIFEGTSQVELLLNYKRAPGGSDHPNVHVMVDYLTASDEPGAFRKGGELQVGTPFVIPIQPLEADMPHQQKSLWIFRIYSGEPTWFNFNITVTIVKGSRVADWPPHPDLYADSPTRVIYDGPVHIENKGTLEANLYGTDVNWQNPERVISYGTERVEIEVTGVSITGEGGTPLPVPPSRYVLEYHNASKPPLLGHGAQYGGRLEDAGTDGTTWRFSIPVEEYGMDSPYGDKSRWGFRFVPKFDDQTGACVDDPFLQQILVGCQLVPFEMDYTIKIVAYGRSISGEGIQDRV